MRNRNDFGRAMDKRAGRTATVHNGVVASRVSSSRYTVTLSDTGETVTATKEVSVDEFIVGQPVRVVGVSAAKTSTGTGWSIMGSGTEIASGGAVGSWSPYGGGHTHVIADVTGLQDALDAKADKVTQIIAGTGLTGGGTLAADRTLTLANTAVTPGTYTHSTITVDAQGRITAASSGSVGVGSGRLLSTTLPLRIDGGASADLSADRTLSINNFTGDAGAGGLKGAVPAPAAGDAAANKFLSAGGGWATAVTDISGLVDLTSPQTITGIKSFTKTYGTDADLPNLLSYDLRAMAAGVGGGIAFGGKYKAAGDTVTFALVRGYKNNGTEADYGGGFQVWTLENGGGAKVRHLDISSTGLSQIVSDGDVVNGNFKEQLRTIPTDGSGKGVRLGYDSSLGNGIIAPTGQSDRLDFWTYQSAAWARTAHLSSGLFVGEGLAAGFKHLTQTGGTNGIYTQIQDQRDYINIDASSNSARAGAPGFLFRESHDDTATWANLVLIGVNGDVVLHASGSLDATSATTGNTFIGCVAGTPTGVPARSVTGAVALRYDTAGSKLWAYNGGWAEIGGGGSYQPLDAALTALAAGSDFVQFTGPTTSTKVFTLPDENATIARTDEGQDFFANSASHIFKMSALAGAHALSVWRKGSTQDSAYIQTWCNEGGGVLCSVSKAGVFTGALSGNATTASSAAKWTTARNLAGNSVDGSANVAFSNKFIVQGTTDAGLSAAQFLGALGTGIVKNTTTTGVLSIAAAGDFPVLNQDTTGIAGGLDATVTAGYLQVNGPTVARLMTTPDAAFSVARKDASETFSVGSGGNVTVSGSNYPNIIATSSDANGGVLQLVSSAGQYQLYLQGDELRFYDGAADVLYVSHGGAMFGGPFNNVTITAPATSATLTIADGRTVTVGTNIGFAHVRWDFAVDGGALGTMTPATTTTIPDNAIIVHSIFNTTTTMTSGGAGTIAFGIAGLATNFLGGAFSTAQMIADNLIMGFQDATPRKTTAAGAMNITIAGAALTAGVIEGVIWYYVAAA